MFEFRKGETHDDRSRRWYAEATELRLTLECHAESHPRLLEMVAEDTNALLLAHRILKGDPDEPLSRHLSRIRADLDLAKEINAKPYRNAFVFYAHLRMQWAIRWILERGGHIAETDRDYKKYLRQIVGRIQDEEGDALRQLDALCEEDEPQEADEATEFEIQKEATDA